MSNEITIEEVNECFLETLYRSRKALLLEDDDTIEYNLFEEFQGGLTFIHETVLKRLLIADFINQEILDLSIELGNKAEEALFEDENKRLAKYVRTNPKWHEVFELSDKIKILKSEFDMKRPK